MPETRFVFRKIDALREEERRPIRRRSGAMQLYGILGGMGPLAGAHLFRRITELTKASSDQEHIPIILYSVPQIPDRSDAILGRGKSPLPEILRGLSMLTQSGVHEVALACNTAHYWHEQMSTARHVPIIHIVDAVISRLQQSIGAATKIGILATDGTVRGGFYKERLQKAGFSIEDPTRYELDELIGPAIHAVKAGEMMLAERLFVTAAMRQLDRGVEKIILGCTEVGIVLHETEASPYLDSTESLARYCVARWHKKTPSAPTYCGEGD